LGVGRRRGVPDPGKSNRIYRGSAHHDLDVSAMKPDAEMQDELHMLAAWGFCLLPLAVGLLAALL
jgi:hypothetical protein